MSWQDSYCMQCPSVHTHAGARNSQQSLEDTLSDLEQNAHCHAYQPACISQQQDAMLSQLRDAAHLRCQG